MLQNNFKSLFDAIKIMSLSYEFQKNNLPKYADIEDEIVSDFENSFSLLPQIVENKMLSYKAISMILRLYNKVEWCVRNIGIDDFGNEEWDSVRKIANDIIDLLQSEGVDL
ncbi:hypothetical protein OF897_17395 [Chryseobacterium formosus]|uniref:Uncharacterized protein n=1 Tax=Chryseobacterium formosus TaxID=1537363 RepID=A0ABT3XVJ7_9FLAO|nr:hypothetical protein [Chryseobacterium formosus]MCX8525693.1 hypothetical protein [Chryseobacterium formosus]